jgi:hypothetical protein
MGQQAARQKTKQDMASRNSIILFINLPSSGLEIFIGCTNAALPPILLEVEPHDI